MFEFGAKLAEAEAGAVCDLSAAVKVQHFDVSAVLSKSPGKQVKHGRSEVKGLLSDVFTSFYYKEKKPCFAKKRKYRLNLLLTEMIEIHYEIQQSQKNIKSKHSWGFLLFC